MCIKNIIVRYVSSARLVLLKVFATVTGTALLLQVKQVSLQCKRALKLLSDMWPIRVPKLQKGDKLISRLTKSRGFLKVCFKNTWCWLEWLIWRQEHFFSSEDIKTQHLFSLGFGDGVRQRLLLLLYSCFGEQLYKLLEVHFRLLDCFPHKGRRNLPEKHKRALSCVTESQHVFEKCNLKREYCSDHHNDETASELWECRRCAWNMALCIWKGIFNIVSIPHLSYLWGKDVSESLYQNKIKGLRL